MLIPDPDLLEPASKDHRIRQRMPAGSRRGSEVAIDIEMQRSRKVAGPIRRASLAGLPQIPTAVHDPQQWIIDRVGQRRNVDERSSETDAHRRNAHRSGMSPIGPSTNGSPEPVAGRSRPVM